MSCSLFGQIRIYLGVAALLLFVFPAAPSTHEASGHFEVYCDSFGFFLAKIDGAPAPGEFFLFLYRTFPGFVEYLPEEEWLEISVHPKGCPNRLDKNSHLREDVKCDAVGHGRLSLDAKHEPGEKRISGKYDIDFNGQHATGRFVATRREYRDSPRICE
jgi:hypothetical protein